MRVESASGMANRTIPDKMQRRLNENLESQTSQVVGTLDKETNHWLAGLLKSRPDANVMIKDLENTKAVRDFAASHYGELQVVISPTALKRMAADPEFRKQCEEALTDALSQLEKKLSNLGISGKRILGKGIYLDDEGKTSQWTASEPPQSFEERMPWKMTIHTKEKESAIDRYRTKEGKVYEIKRKLNYRPSRDLIRIAKAHNQQAAKSAISSIRASIYQLRSASGERQKAKQLIGQAEQVLRKAQLKVKHLKKEELMEYGEKRAREKEEIRRAAHIRRQLKEQRTKRISREYGQIRDYYPTPQEVQREKEHAKAWLEQVSDGTLSGGAYGLGAYLAAPAVSAGTTASGSVGAVIDITF